MQTANRSPDQRVQWLAVQLHKYDYGWEVIAMGFGEAVKELGSVLWYWLTGRGPLLELLLSWLEVVTGAAAVDCQAQETRPSQGG